MNIFISNSGRYIEYTLQRKGNNTKGNIISWYKRKYYSFTRVCVTTQKFLQFPVCRTNEIMAAMLHRQGTDSGDGDWFLLGSYFSPSPSRLPFFINCKRDLRQECPWCLPSLTDIVSHSIVLHKQVISHGQKGADRKVSWSQQWSCVLTPTFLLYIDRNEITRTQASIRVPTVALISISNEQLHKV